MVLHYLPGEQISPSDNQICNLSILVKRPSLEDMSKEFLKPLGADSAYFPMQSALLVKDGVYRVCLGGTITQSPEQTIHLSPKALEQLRFHCLVSFCHSSGSGMAEKILLT